MTGDYVSLYLNTAYAQNDLLPFLSLMFLFMGRMLPIIALVPFFGGRVLPRPVKVTFAISLFAIFLPQLLMETKTPLTFNLQLLLYLVKEVFVGVLLGFFLSIPFAIVQNTGILIDHQRGGSSLMVNDPTIQNQSSPLGTLFNYVLIYLFFMIDGPFIVLDIISQSYKILPPDKLLNSALFAETSQVVQYTTKILGNVMILSTQLAAPALIMILMTDFFLGIANRLAPQVQITFLGMPLKSLLALTIVFFGWTLFTQEIVNQAHRALNYLAFLIQQFQPS
jgi:type III secretion protein T